MTAPDDVIRVVDTGRRVEHPPSCGGCHGAGCPVVRPAEPLTDAWPDEFTPEVLERIVVEALKQHDLDGVEHALRLLAVRDIDRCERMIDTLRLGIVLAGGMP